MIGAIIGDIVGSRFEFNNTDRYDFDLFTPECNFTDDTICTVAIANEINVRRKILHYDVTKGEYGISLHNWCNKYPNPMGGYGGNFAKWVHSRKPEAYNSFGNGSAMRVSPVAWYFDDLETVLSQAKKTALPTHNHPEGIKGAVAVAHAIYYLRTTHNVPGLEVEMDRYYSRFMLGNYFAGVFDETCQGTVPICLKIILSSTSFEDAIRKAISWGGDSDTIGAIVGSMAEAAFGIPKDLSDKALEYLPTDMLNVIGDFFHNLNNK